jgi:hypothetical protein
MSNEDFKGFNLLAADSIPMGEIKEVDSIPEGPLGEVTFKDEPTEEATEEKSEIVDKRTKQDDTIEIKHVDSIEEIEEEEEETETITEEEPKVEDKTPAKQEVEEIEDSVFKTIASEFSDKGLLSDLGEDFEDSEEGFAALIDKTVNEKVNEYKDSLPEVAKNFVDYVKAGGDPQHFVDAYAKIDYTRIDPDALSTNEAAQREIVYNQLAKEGYNADEIAEEIEDFIDGGILEKKAKRALSKMVQYQEKEQKEVLERQKAEAAAYQEQQEKFMADLKEDILKRDDIAGFEFSGKKQKDNFYDYITKIDRKTGKTQLQLDNESDPEAQLKMAWFYFNKFNFSKVEKKAKTKAVSDLKSKLQKATDSSNKLKSKRKTSSPDDNLGSDFSGFKKVL